MTQLMDLSEIFLPYIARSNSGKGIQLVFALLVFGGISAYKGFRSFKLRREIEDTPTSPIRSAAQGLTEIEGFAWPRSIQIALNGEPFCYYHFDLQEYRQRGKSGSWESILKYSSMEPFYIIDQTGVCEVNTNKIDINFTSQTIKLSNLTDSQFDILQSICPEIKQYRPASTGLFKSLFQPSRRIIESAIYCGSPVYAKGNFQTKSQSTSHLLDGIHQFWSEIKQNKQSKKPENLDHGFFRSFWISKSKNHLSTDKHCEVEISGIIAQSENHDLIVFDGHQQYALNTVGNFSVLLMIGGVVLIGTAIILALFYTKFLF